MRIDFKHPNLILTEFVIEVDCLIEEYKLLENKIK